MTKMFTKEEQLKFMENLDISPIERLLSEKLKVEIKFSKNIYEKDENIQMELASQDLKEYTGILSSQYEYLKLITFGSCSFYIDKDDKINFAAPSIYYNFKYTDEELNKVKQMLMNEELNNA